MTDASSARPRTGTASQSERQRRSTASTVERPHAECTSVDQVCDWLSHGRPTLDEVASCLRSLIVAKRELDDVVELLRQHAFAELGQSLSSGPAATKRRSEGLCSEGVSPLGRGA